MNIAIFCHDFKSSGANLSLIDWLKDADKVNYNFIVILPRYNKQYYELLEKIGINNIIIGHFMVITKKLYKLSFIDIIKEFIKKVYALFFNNVMYVFIEKKLKKYNVDIIHSNSFSIMAGAKISKKMNIPHIFHVREFMEEDHQITHYNKNKIKKYCKESYAIFISDVIANKYRKKYNFIYDRVLYDKIHYDCSYLKKRKFMEDGCCNIIIVGTISKNKGHLDAIMCIRELNKNNINSKLFICGSGPLEDNLKKFVKDNNISNVKFLGYQNNVVEIRKNMDIALMCSNSEALGRVTIEAQYYENLIIGANCGCTPFLIDNNSTGFLYNKLEKNDLFNKVKKCIENKKRSEQIILNAKTKAIARFDKDISKDIIGMYEFILKNRDNDKVIKLGGN